MNKLFSHVSEVQLEKERIITDCTYLGRDDNKNLRHSL